jgi:hypothetical protein
MALLFLSVLALAFAPWVPLLPLRLLPGGDQWWLVAARVAIVLAWAAAYRPWIGFAQRVAIRVFTGKFTPEFDDWLRHQELPPVGAWQGVRANAYLGLFAALGLAVFLGYLDPRAPLLAVHNAPKKFRGLVAVVQWCRGHPNTVSTSSLVVGVGSLALYGYRVRAAVQRKAEGCE